MKDLVFKERLVKKLVDRYVGLYIINNVVSTNMVKLWLPMSMRIYLVVNISWVVWYREQVGEQKKEEVKLIEVEEVKEWEVEKILNKRKERGVVKYLVRWKEFIAKNDSWKKEENLKNMKELVEEFKRKMEVRRQEKLELLEEKDFRRTKLPRRYTVKLLYE